jgi:hypothetical protein
MIAASCKGQELQLARAFHKDTETGASAAETEEGIGDRCQAR